MLHSPIRSGPRASRLVAAVATGLALAGCGGVSQNRSLYSVHQPVVEHNSFSFDVTTGPDGLAAGEKQRLADWFAAVDLRYGDRIALQDPVAGEATRRSVEAVLSHYGLLLSRDPAATPSYVNAGTARVVVIRATASVPHCPDWSGQNEANPNNATSSNYGCAVNSNLAAMIANPDDLVKGAPNTGVSAVVSNDKAINAYTTAPASGSGGSLKVNSTKSGS